MTCKNSALNMMFPDLSFCETLLNSTVNIITTKTKWNNMKASYQYCWRAYHSFFCLVSITEVHLNDFSEIRERKWKSYH